MYLDARKDTLTNPKNVLLIAIDFFEKFGSFSLKTTALNSKLKLIFATLDKRGLLLIISGQVLSNWLECIL